MKKWKISLIIIGLVISLPLYAAEPAGVKRFYYRDIEPVNGVLTQAECQKLFSHVDVDLNQKKSDHIKINEFHDFDQITSKKVIGYHEGRWFIVVRYGTAKIMIKDQPERVETYMTSIVDTQKNSSKGIIVNKYCKAEFTSTLKKSK